MPRYEACRVSETHITAREPQKSVGDTQPIETPPLRSVAKLGGVKKRIITRLGRRPYTAAKVQGLRPIPLHSTTLAPPNFAPLRKGGASSGEASSMLFYLTVVLDYILRWFPPAGSVGDAYNSPRDAKECRRHSTCWNPTFTKRSVVRWGEKAHNHSIRSETLH